MADAMQGWTNFFVAEAGAAAALAGLLFVAVSINLTRILEFANLPARVVESLAAFIAVLFIASFALAPQPLGVFGVETASTGVILLAINLMAFRADFKAGTILRRELSSARQVLRIVTNQIPPLPFIIGGVVIAMGHASGLYWLLPGTLIAFLSGLFGAWILLIEIQR